MNKILILIIVVVFVGFFAINFTAKENNISQANETTEIKYQEWGKSYQEALAGAKANKKPILMLFTGSDWCPPCKALYNNILNTDSFKAYAKENLVLLVLDFPRGFSLPKEQADHNEEIAEKYGIRAFPTMILLSGEEKELARFGYQFKAVEALTNFLTQHAKPDK